jgi:hypothetical protein
MALKLCTWRDSADFGIYSANCSVDSAKSGIYSAKLEKDSAKFKPYSAKQQKSYVLKVFTYVENV